MRNHAQTQINALLTVCNEARARAILSELGTLAALRDFDTEAQTRYAMHLTEAGESRRTVVHRLCARYGMSEKSAYRRVNEAINRRARPIQKTDEQHGGD